MSGAMPDDDDDNIIVGVGNWFIVEALFIMETYNTTTTNRCMVGRSFKVSLQKLLRAFAISGSGISVWYYYY